MTAGGEWDGADHDVHVRSVLETIVGKTIAAFEYAEIEQDDSDEEAEAIDIVFSDGSRIRIRSCEPYEHRSWLHAEPL